MSEIRQIAGASQIAAALRRGDDVRLLLVREDAPHADVAAVMQEAKERGITVRTATERVIARLCNVAPPEPVLALVGRDPRADIEGMIASGDAIWLMVGVAYPGNVGMVIRTAEVSGAGGIVIDASFDAEGRKAALRAGMRADKFMPVRFEPPDALLAHAARAGHRVLALDEEGEHAPWDVDLTGPCVFIVGGENGGIPPDILERCDVRLRVPMAGFIPCYNLQAAVSAIATERLRQGRIRL